MKLLALFFIILFIVPSAFAASVTVDIFGTNVSNAQSNITQTGNNSYQVVQWAVGDTTKSLKADINGNASDDITFTLHNFTAGRVIEVKVNSSSYNSYQTDATGTISFTRTQTVRNQTYNFTPAVNAGGYNFTWSQFWTFPSLFGLNFTNYFVPYSGATADLDMNNKNITNVRVINSTTVNVTVLNATEIKGDGFQLYNLNVVNVTGLQALQDAMNQSSASNNTASQGRDDTINSTKLNKTDLNSTVNFFSGNASNLTTGVLPSASIPSGVSWNTTLLRVSAYSTVQQDNIPSDTATQVVLSTAIFDTSNSLSSNTITVPRTGYYHIFAQIGYINFIASKPYGTQIWINGAANKTTVISTGTYTGNFHGMQASALLHLSAGDTIRLYAWHLDGTGTVDIIGAKSETYLDVYELGVS